MGNIMGPVPTFIINMFICVLTIVGTILTILAMSVAIIQFIKWLKEDIIVKKEEPSLISVYDAKEWVEKLEDDATNDEIIKKALGFQAKIKMGES